MLGIPRQKMPPPASSPDPDAEFAEVDPTGRYGRYKEVLGKGAFKTVYKAFDQLEGIEVAWNQVKVGDLLRNSDDLERLRSEVRLLKTLKHKNIIKFYNSWVDKKNDNINFITEVFTSGTLRQYRIKHKQVDSRALKKWSRQILSGLLYLHSHDPPVIHRDLKCVNIFVNGNQGEVKIGDLGLATILYHAHSAHSVIGTPEFMAPELYEEEYNELVDVYAFGMCLLELVTLEYPYVECTSAAQIYKKVSAGIKPASLAKVKDPEVKMFIEKCIAKVSERLSAKELLMDPFLLDIENENIICHSPLDINQADNASRSNPSTSYTYDRADSSRGSWNFAAAEGQQPDMNTIFSKLHIRDSTDPSTSSHIYDRTEPFGAGRDVTVEGQRKDINTIFLKLHITDSTGQGRNIHFPFDIEADTSISVATEMVAELDLTDQDVTMIAEMIDAEIQLHVPEWMANESSDNQGDDVTVSDSHGSEANDELSSLPNESDVTPSGFVLEWLPSGRKYWSSSPKRSSEDSPSVYAQLRSHTSGDVPDERDNSLDNEKQRGCHSDGTSLFSVEDIFEKTTSPTSRDFLDPAMVDRNSEGADQHPVSDITDRLVHLLAGQQRELNELKKRHEAAIEDVLKGVPLECREETLTRCQLKAYERKL